MKNLLFAVAFVLLMIWLLGIAGVYAVGSGIHLLLLVAVVLFAISFMRDGRSVI
jgi:hypothetical protein